MERLRLPEVPGRLLHTGLVIAGSVATYNTVAAIDGWTRRRRMPRGGDQQSTLPFYERFMADAESAGLVEYTASGGLTKQALADPETQFVPEDLEYIVENPNSATLQSATMFRGRNFTLRDMDDRAKKIRVNGQVYYATPDMFDAHSTELKARLQAGLDETAQELGMGTHGLELSLFFYERDPGKFSLNDYATKTELQTNAEGVATGERIFATTGQQLIVPIENQWTCVVRHGGKEYRIPVDAPVTHLGRTLVRTVVERDRDRKDVDAAVDNITQKGLYEELLGDQWAEYMHFRHELDSVLTIENIWKTLLEQDLTTAAKLLGVKPAALAKSWIEGSAIGTAIQDPLHPIGKLAAKKVMTAAG